MLKWSKGSCAEADTLIIFHRNVEMKTLQDTTLLAVVMLQNTAEKTLQPDSTATTKK